jgi:hypothetical protein
MPPLSVIALGFADNKAFVTLDAYGRLAAAIPLANRPAAACGESAPLTKRAKLRRWHEHQCSSDSLLPQQARGGQAGG